MHRSQEVLRLGSLKKRKPERSAIEPEAPEVERCTVQTRQGKYLPSLVMVEYKAKKAVESV